jgi:adenylate kinase family enzyme
MKTFTDKTLPVIKEYEKAGKIKEISAKRPVDVIYAELVTQIS